MDGVFGSVEGRLKVSLKDSTMMWIVHFAMNKAQERMNTKKGVIERLNEISKFYELAVMQLDGCISFVESETGSSILESNLEEVLDDLIEIRDRLQGRLEESEFAISEKDRELRERLANELKLRQALELKERELISLGANLEVEKARGDNVEDNEGKRNENSEGEFCDLKTSVDQQMLNIKQRLEPDYNVLGKETPRDIDGKKIEEMGSDIDILNQTMDLAFGKMKSALFLCEMGPKEKKWKLKIEKDIMSLLIKSFMREFQENIEAQLRKQEEVFKGWWEHWPQLMNEVTRLQHELVPLMQVTCADDTNSCALSSVTDFWQKAFQESEGKPLPEETSHNRPKSKRSSPKGDEKNQMKDDKEEENNFVAKMIKNHEFIIRKKSEELSSYKHGSLQEKRSSPTKRGKEHDCLKGRIQDVAARLDSLLNWNAKLRESLYGQGVVHKMDTLPEDKLSEFNVIGKAKESNDTFESAWKKIEGASHGSNELQDKIRDSKQEKEDRESKGMVLQGMDIPLHKNIEEEFDSDRDIERQIQEHVCKYYLKEFINRWNENIERNKIERQIRDEVIFIVLSEAAKDNCLTYNFNLAECHGGGTEKCSDKEGNIEGTIREDICMLIFREMVKEYNKILEDYNGESLVEDDKCKIVSFKTVKNSAGIASKDCIEDSIEENLLKEDVYMVVFRGMLKDWKIELCSYFIENLINEEINECIMVEALKYASNLSREVKSPIQGNIMEDTYSTVMINQVQNVKGEEKFLRILESLVRCFEAEEYLMLSAKSEMKEHSRQFDLGSERGELHEHEIFEDLITDEEQTFCSVTSKVEKALHQLFRSKTLLRELVNSLGHMASESEKMHSQTNITEMKMKSSSSVFLPLLEFSQIFAEFEGMVNKRLEMVSERLEKMKYFLDSVIELAICLRNNELLYQKAFFRRCQNLIKAEAEVDLLGDQVDALASLLEKVYAILHQYAPALQQYFEVRNLLSLFLSVSDILELIKNELIGGAATSASVVT
ncbi:hypothetical protein L6164_005755 [Bauhinia variegata]|uniref:Uncharacterized protein n=1 Tax=Bauhinia variegata TaxID=167791 RepID=A0ACB9PRH8_BAUVA|nr:hypothetical protein L6164_005755 [Bauhinia variegata]